LWYVLYPSFTKFIGFHLISDTCASYVRYLLINAELTTPLQGLPSTITVKNGDRFTGIFSTATLESAEYRYVLKMAKKLASSQNNHINGVTETSEDYIGTGPDHIMTFDTQDVVDLSVNNARLDQTSSRVTNGSFHVTSPDSIT